MASPAVDFARSNQQRFLNELKDLLRIPSVSTLEQHKPDIQKAANFVASELRRIGLENVEIVPTKGHPLIYADWLHASGKPTVLMYAHYDVQPAEPLDEWHTPPFEPTERNQNLYARGAVDDKGQLWMEVKALEALMRGGGGKLPINVKIIFEGEEEVGGEAIAEQADGGFAVGLFLFAHLSAAGAGDVDAEDFGVELFRQARERVSDFLGRPGTADGH